MRKRLVLALVAFLPLLTLAPPARAQVPAPKVTITGLFDQVTSMGRNFYDGNYAGQVCGFVGGCKFGTGGGLDLNTDVAGLFEIKWIYTEFDLTGKDSLLPFIPVLTVARAGGQPFATLANYKVAYANGDFAGLDLYTTFTPEIKLDLAYVIVEDQLAGGNRAPTGAPTRTNRGEDYAFILSPEFTPVKGLDLKPLFSWFHADGLTSASSRRNAINRRTVGSTAA